MLNSKVNFDFSIMKKLGDLAQENLVNIQGSAINLKKNNLYNFQQCSSLKLQKRKVSIVVDTNASESPGIKLLAFLRFSIRLTSSE